MDSLIFVYAIADLILALQISISNFVVIWVYVRSKHVRTPTNAYIFSLALTDFFAGSFGIPATVYSVLTRKPTDFLSCLAVHLILCILCTISTFHLLAMAIDKYLTICCKSCQFFDQQNRQTRSKILIFLCWVIGGLIGSMPLFDAFKFASNTRINFKGQCYFTTVVDYQYMVYVIFFGTIILPSLVIVFCYAQIYKKIRKEEKQIKCLLRASERQRRMNNRRKLIRIMIILVTTYAICWYPLYLINTYDLFRRILFNFRNPSHPAITLLAVVLSHFNCALNPLIYAYGVPGFKHSLRRFLPQIYKNVSNAAGGNGKSDFAKLRNGTYLNDRETTAQLTLNNGSCKHSIHLKTNNKIYLPDSLFLARNSLTNPSTLKSVQKTSVTFLNTSLTNNNNTINNNNNYGPSKSLDNVHLNENNNLIEEKSFIKKTIGESLDYLSNGTSSLDTIADVLVPSKKLKNNDSRINFKKYFQFNNHSMNPIVSTEATTDLGQLKKVSYTGISLLNSFQTTI